VCESGEGLFLSEGEFFSLSAGDAVLVPPGKRHYSRSIDPDALCFCRFAYVLPEVLRAALSPFCDDVDRFLAESNAFPTVLRGEEAREIHAAFRDTGVSADAATVLHLAVLLLTLPRTQATPTQAAPSGRAESELAQYLSLHYAENESIGTLAAKHHMSESQLRRKFVAAYGMPPIAYRNRLRCKIGEELLSNIVTENKELPESAKIDLIVALITLKYTQSNSVCFAVDGQAIGVGAGQQSRIHCTRLAGTKADTWFLRQHPKTLNLPFRADLGRPNRDNVIDGYINGNEEDVCAEGIWQNYFTEQPERLTDEDKKQWLSSRQNVALGSDAFFPFSDNIKRAYASGVKYIAEPGGSIRDDLVIEECNKKGIVMAFTGMRLFHH
jgi:AraC-like DNA-binding protein